MYYSITLLFSFCTVPPFHRVCGWRFLKKLCRSISLEPLLPLPPSYRLFPTFSFESKKEETAIFSIFNVLFPFSRWSLVKHRPLCCYLYSTALPVLRYPLATVYVRLQRAACAERTRIQTFATSKYLVAWRRSIWKRVQPKRHKEVVEKG